jgi:hypothetical protein
MPELALKTHLLSKTDISSVVGTRVDVGDVDPSRDGLPDVLFRLNTLDNEETFGGDAEDLQFPIYEFDARSSKPSECYTLADNVRRALRELATGATITTTLGDVVIDQLQILGVEDQTSTFEANGKSRIVYTRTILVQVGFRQSVAAIS